LKRGANAHSVARMKHVVVLTALTLSLSACGGQFPNPFEGLKKQPKPEVAAEPEAPLDAINLPETPVAPVATEVEVGAGGQSADALDQTTEAEKAAATQAPVNTSDLGTTIASLGDPTEQGFWMRTPLVSAETDGVVETEGGAIVKVKLIPIDGPPTAGSRLSLSAMRALDLGLTDLATLRVSRS